ncbi:MAG TPA: hypothetical protein VFX16_22165 [Pseudonocardiaceae bacterium]|nr:hypothetical protein [Pseudonocardiaceae bacterium]
MKSAAIWLYQISDRLLIGLFAIALLTSPFYQVAYLRTHLLGTATPPAAAGLAVLALGVAIVWRSVLHRDFTWADPARLTWADLTDTRVGSIGRRLWASWATRFLAAAYLTVFGVLLLGTSAWLPAGAALFAGVAVLAVVLARRKPGRTETALEYVVLCGLAALAVSATVTTVAPTVLWAAAAGAVLAAIASARNSGPVRHPTVATSAGRRDLVAGYMLRVVRQVSVSFGDALALLPPAGPLPWPRLLAGKYVVVRFVLVGVLSRARALLPAVLAAIAVGVLHQVLPLVDPVWLIGIGVYFAGVPFAAALASLCAVPGLRRWLGCTDLTLRLATAGLVVVVALVWVGLVAVFAVPLALAAWLAVPLAVGAVVRTVTRPPLDYGNVGVAVTPDGNMVPVGLLLQLAHGPEVLVIGLLVIGFGLALTAAAPVALALAAFGVAR